VISVTPNLEQVFRPGGWLNRAIGMYEFRQSQLTMAEWVAEALQSNQHLCVEAGPGTGKTLAYLVPVILGGRKAIVSTATKALQAQLAEKDLPLLAQILPFPFSFMQAKGRSNYLCLKKWRDLASATSLWDQGKVRWIHQWMQKSENGDLAGLPGYAGNAPEWPDLDARKETCLGAECPFYADCYVTLLRQRAAKTDILVVNHHLFFADLALKRDGWEGVLPEREVVVFDEAHRIEEIATHFFSINMGLPFFEEWWRDMQVANGDFGEDWVDMRLLSEHLLQKAKSFFFAHRIPSTQAGSQRFYPDASEKFLPYSREGGIDLERHMKDLALHSHFQGKSDRVAELAQRLERLRQNLAFILSAREESYIYCCESHPYGLSLQALPLEVSGFLSETLFAEERTVILASATLAASEDFSFIRSRLGLRHAREGVLPSEFCMEKQAILYIPEDLVLPNHKRFAQTMAERALELLAVTQGRAFLLFTSLLQMRAVHALLANQVSFPLLLQGEKPAEVLLAEFRRTPNAVLLGVQSFWQGIDVQGDALSCVIVEKLPFSVPTDPLLAARLERIREEGGNPFMDYQVPEAILLLKQGLGRLIRSRSDHGVLALFDRRILTRPYGRQFRENLPPCRLTHDLQEVRRFFLREKPP